MTRISLSSIFGLANTQDNWKLGAGRYSLEMHNNAYVRDLHQRGYKITLHQSSYIALCTGLPGERCFTHSRAGNAHAYAAITDDLWLRTRYALIEMDNQLSSLSASGTVAVYALAKQLAIRLGIQVEPPDYYSTPAAMMVVLDDVEAKLKEMKRGEVYIVHVLLPHAPYTLDTDCKVKPPGQWSRGTRPDRPVTMTDAEIYSGYWDQVGCMGRRLNTLVDIILATEAGKDATILVHGDHGARVTLERAAGENQDDLVQTLFAVRTPTLKGAVIAEPKVLQDLFLETYRRQFP